MTFEQKNVPMTEPVAHERSLALQLQQALLQISQYAQGSTVDATAIETTARRTLDLIDCYLAGSCAPNQLKLQLEPVALGSIMQDAMHQLYPAARQYGCQLWLKSAGKTDLVYTDKSLAKLAFVGLGHSLIEEAANRDASRRVVFAIKPHRNGPMAGVFSPGMAIRSRSLHQLKALRGQATRQSGDFSGTATGVVLADKLLDRIDRQLFATSFQRLKGFAVTFDKSTQLQIV